MTLATWVLFHLEPNQNLRGEGRERDRLELQARTSVFHVFPNAGENYKCPAIVRVSNGSLGAVAVILKNCGTE